MTSIPPWKTHEPDATNLRNTRGQNMIDSRRYGYMNVVGGSELKLEQATMERVCNDKAGDGSSSSCGRSGTVCTTRRASIAATNSIDNQGVDETNSSHRRRVRGSLVSTPQRSNDIRIRACTGSLAAATQEGSTAGSIASCPAGGISRGKRDVTRASRDLLEPLRTKGRQHFGLKRNRPSENSNSGDEQGTEARRGGSPHRLIRRSLIADDTGYSSPSVCKSTRISPPIQTNISVGGRPSQDAVRQHGSSFLARAYSQESLGDSAGDHAWRREDEGKGVAKSFVSITSENPPGNRAFSSDSVGSESPPVLQPLQHSLKVQRLCSSPISSSSPIDTLTVGVESLGVFSPGAPLGAKDDAAASRTTTDLIWPRRELEGVSAAKMKASRPQAPKLNRGTEPLAGRRKVQRGEPSPVRAQRGEDSSLWASSSTHVLQSARGSETAFDDSPASTALLRESSSSTKENSHEQSTSRTSPPSPPSPLSPLFPPSPSSPPPPPSPPSPPSRSPRSHPVGNQGRRYSAEVCNWNGQERSVAMDVDVTQGNHRSSGGDLSNSNGSPCLDAATFSTRARGPVLANDAEATSTFGDNDGEAQGEGQDGRDCDDGDGDRDGGAGSGTGGAGAGSDGGSGSNSGSGGGSGSGDADNAGDGDDNAGDADDADDDAGDGGDDGDGDDDGGGGGGGGDGDDDSSDAGAAHEEISVWLHSTQDWWTS